MQFYLIEHIDSRYRDIKMLRLYRDSILSPAVTDLK